MSTTTAKRPRFTADQFHDSKYRTAKDKALTLNALFSWIDSGFRATKFTQRVYKFLTVDLSMSAEYNLNGFYAYHTSTDMGRANLLTDIIACLKDCANRVWDQDYDRNGDVFAQVDEHYGDHTDTATQHLAWLTAARDQYVNTGVVASHDPALNAAVDELRARAADLGYTLVQN